MSHDAPSILKGLNPSQRRAVEHDSGPLMVLAGPGTGKTRVITHRVAHLMLERGVEPEQIVAVTYTVKAAKQLRERLHALVGSAAERVQASTIHSLGQRLVRRFGDVIDLPPPGEGGGRRGGGGIIDSAQRKRLLLSIVTEKGLFPHAKAMGVDSVVEMIEGHLRVFEDAGLSPEDVREFSAEAGKRLDVGRGWSGEELDAAGLQAERARVANLSEVVRAWEGFDAARRERGWLTFGDLITLPVRILKSSEYAAAIVRDEWRHLVVDEFQDANTAQIRLLHALAPPERNPDLCVVGDDDQSIYEFRGADDRAFARFAAIWSGAERIDLSENYRSAGVIIDLGNSVISRADVRFAPDKTITEPQGVPTEARLAAQHGAAVQCVQLEDDKQDGEVIAAMLLIDRAAHPERKWSKYAVVARTHGDVARIHAALMIEGIPAIASRTGSPIDDEGVKDVLAWVSVIARPRLTHPVLRLLMRPPISVQFAKAQQWERQYRARLSRFEAGQPDAADPGGFADWIAANAGEDAAAAKFLAWHEEFRALNGSKPAAETIFRIITATDAAHADLLPARERAGRVGDLVSLVRFARERQGRLDEPGDLRAFMSYYDDLSESEQKLGESSLGDRVDGSGDDADGEAVNAVRLVTAHSAKGLEFDTVFVPRVSPAHGYPNSKSDDGVDLPTGLIERDGDDRSVKERKLAEERRVFYVACTRAERRLVLLAKKNKSASKSTHYFEEIVRDEAMRGKVEVFAGEDVLKQAAEQGVGEGHGWGSPSRTEIDGERSGGTTASGGGGFAAAQKRREVFDRARRDIRAHAAGALDHAERAEDAPDRADESGAALRDAAARLAALAYAEVNGTEPAWADERNVGVFVRGVLERAGRGIKDDDAGGAASSGLVAPKAPLELSYTYLNEYIRCPRCFYLKHVVGLEPMAGVAQVVGIAVHRALEKFYGAIRSAEGEGIEPPGLDRLLALGREEFFKVWPRNEEVDRAQLEQVQGQLRMAHDRLHDSGANILEIEKKFTFAYGPHSFGGKIDRIDQVTLSDGSTGFRIVDYKTGTSHKYLLEPAADDLQLGIYALALAHTFGTGDPAADKLPGVAEYWLLSTGERGSIPLTSIKHDKVRKKIDEAVAGILAGRFEKGKNCTGECDLLGPG